VPCDAKEVIPARLVSTLARGIEFCLGSPILVTWRKEKAKARCLGFTQQEPDEPAAIILALSRAADEVMG